MSQCVHFDIVKTTIKWTWCVQYKQNKKKTIYDKDFRDRILSLVKNYYVLLTPWFTVQTRCCGPYEIASKSTIWIIFFLNSTVSYIYSNTVGLNIKTFIKRKTQPSIFSGLGILKGYLAALNILIASGIKYSFYMNIQQC